MLLSDEKVKAVLFNIFGGITRCDEVANGILQALDQIDVKVPIVVRLDGTNDEEGRRILARGRRPAAAPGEDDARGRRHGGRAGEGRSAGVAMAILVDESTKLRRPGPDRPRGLASTACATASTAPTWSPASRPARAARTSRACPIFDTVHEAVAETGANTAMVFVPPPFAADAIYEAADAGIETIICITEGIPAHDMLRVYNYLAGHRTRA